MLEFINVSAQYGKIQALHEVSLSVRKGEIVTLIGANGAGKTTLLSTLCGEPRATTGEIRYLGEFFASKTQYQARIAQVYELFPRLQERRHQRAGTMSGGEQQMLAIGRALMSSPQLLLLDEPSLGLAPIIIMQIFDTIRELRDAGMTIFLVEQNANQALKLADRGYVLENGRVVLEDTGQALLVNEAVRSAYLGG